MKKFAITCIGQRNNTYRQMFSRIPDCELIQLHVNGNSDVVMVGLSVEEAETLAKDLLDLVKEIKGEEVA